MQSFRLFGIVFDIASSFHQGFMSPRTMVMGLASPVLSALVCGVVLFFFFFFFCL